MEHEGSTKWSDENKLAGHNGSPCAGGHMGVLHIVLSDADEACI